MALRLVVASIAGALIAPAAHAEPFLTRNQNALVAVYGLPSPLPARLPAAGNGRIAGVVNWSNTETDETSRDAQYTLDAEVFELRLLFERAFGERYAFRVELPWRKVSGGSLDGLIDNWHGIFGLPEGSRDRLPEDQLLIDFREGATTLLRFDESSSGIGDLSAAVGYQLQSGDRSAIAAWLTVKAPTGSADDLTGSGATDVAVTLSGQTQLAERWQLFGQSSVAWLGEGDVLPEQQESFAWTLMGGLTWNAWRRLDLTVQVEANSRLYDGLHSDFDGDAVVLTFGGAWRTAGGWRFDVAVSEDVQTGASPDVNFVLAAVREY
jgi:Protein of unknown function (DUF3187)